ncbi:MAG: hypothetical protein AVW06_00845 [Hadesarchaea archaeon DG-33-1]|nr:MAG: hypothetical protein AVW06_00845 [Hadesarchaea archaeon DG-33-1]
MSDLTVRLAVSKSALRAILIISGVFALIAGLIILVAGVFNIGWGIDPIIAWADRVDTMSKLVPVGYILLAVGMISLAAAYRIASGSAAGSLLISLAVVVWVIILLEPTSTIGIYASRIVEGTLALVTMTIAALGLSNVVSGWRGYGSSGTATAGYTLIILFGIFYLVGEILAIVSLEVINPDLARVSVGIMGAGFLFGGIAGILLLAAFLATSARLPSRARRR